jgi:hypothetical protein
LGLDRKVKKTYNNNCYRLTCCVKQKAGSGSRTARFFIFETTRILPDLKILLKLCLLKGKGKKYAS